MTGTGGFVIDIRAERPDDFAAVHRVNAAAFPSDAEARLVDRIRPLASPSVSLVATDAGEVVGHVFFSPVTVDAPEGASSALALAPLAVLPSHQNAGVGGALTRAGLAACEALGEYVVFVLGHRDYYPRFGFARADAHALYFDEPGANPAFLVAELRAGAVAGRSGEVRYLPPFYAM